jgi:hypothetical protein
VVLAHTWGNVVEGQLLQGGGEGLLVPTIKVHTVKKLHR